MQWSALLCRWFWFFVDEEKVGKRRLTLQVKRGRKWKAWLWMAEGISLVMTLLGYCVVCEQERVAGRTQTTKWPKHGNKNQG